MPLPYLHTRRNESSSLRLDMYPYYSDIKFGKKAKRKKNEMPKKVPNCHQQMWVNSNLELLGEYRINEIIRCV